MSRLRKLKNRVKEKKPSTQESGTRAALKDKNRKADSFERPKVSIVEPKIDSKAKKDIKMLVASKERDSENGIGVLNSVIDQLIQASLLDTKRGGYDGDVSDTDNEVEGVSDTSDMERDDADNIFGYADISSEDKDIEIGGGESIGEKGVG